MSNENNKGTHGNSEHNDEPFVVDDLGKPTLPDFDTLRELARNNPTGLERLRLALCQKVIDEAPPQSRGRLEGLMFQINARRELAKTDMQATAELSQMMNESLRRMQAMLKDLRTIQSESILLSTRGYLAEENAGNEDGSATVLPFKSKGRRR
ncbi:MAG: DUF3135 domain-containing protein [Gammaproteobacteria bacterium]|nr:DUF3135 domain-containing protein [Gammaproteobacteria bacterium]